VHKSALSRLASRPRSVGAVVLAMISIATQVAAMAAASGWSPGGPAAPRASMASAVIRTLQCAGTAPRTQPCPAPSPVALAAGEQREHVVVPTGSSQCPDSGPGASCVSHPTPADSGNSAVPEGLPACPADPAKLIQAPGSCDPQPATGPALPAASQPVLPAAPAADPANVIAAAQTLTLIASGTAVAGGGVIFLDAQSSLDVSGTAYAIEIFDLATGGVIAACTQTADCKVSFSAKSGLHSFLAYVVAPTSSLPSAGIQLTSNRVDVRFLGISLAATSNPVVAPGKAVTFTATATEEVSKVGYRIAMVDAGTGGRLTFCSRGTTCSTALVEPTSGAHTVIATLEPQSAAGHSGSADIHARSNPVSATWLGVELAASSNSTAQGGTVSLSANANADLSKTPYSIYFFDQSGAQVGPSCNSATCTTTAPAGPGSAPTFIAVIGQVAVAGAARGTLASVLNRVPVAINRLDVQAASTPVKPVHTMWGVDSCKRMTDDPTGATGLLPQVTSILGVPDFWGRYLPPTGNCPGLNSVEIAAAHSRHIGILPIYNDYDCSAVSGNGLGSQYAQAAIRWLQNDLIPRGTAIAVDIEPAGDACPGAANVDAGFIAGWYDVLTQAGYAPAYYGNTSPGSAFAIAWCAAAQQRPEIANNSYLWSFEPSLVGNFSKQHAPVFGSYSTTCAGHYMGWQYTLSAGGTPDVDQDELSSQFPIWYP
jgi:hypothetical protein